MQTPEELNQEGVGLCQAGNFEAGLTKFRQGLIGKPRPVTRMMLNNNIALALIVLAGWEQGGRSPVNKHNVEYLDEALTKFKEVCRIYEQEIEGTAEEEDFTGHPKPKEYMKNAFNLALDISAKLEQFQGAGISPPAKQEPGSQEVPAKSEKSGCFVATAALGTPGAEEVIILSNFRDEYLSRSFWGRKLISFYYRYSPSLASLIAGKKPLCRLARFALIHPTVRLIRACCARRPHWTNRGKLA